jgi:hypothetical protein
MRVFSSRASKKAGEMHTFPSDLNGDVLRRMVENGDNLSVPRDIDFIVVTPDAEAAARFAEVVGKWGLALTVEHADVVTTLPWEVRVVSHMLPTHEGITQLEQRLGHEAALVGGRNDGWGCFEQK